ncbi:hypothetical protein LTS18_007622 [Coniosporium uncinatum]|uniref:Uncharacterized protein n=1 Tax=Coniosporium uncinatum TaxID=93489 RepID=A0ACC3DAE5_9PEZI|nr:hypothetical protein LTS18_007622 [Coniosporium uncinatum]
MTWSGPPSAFRKHANSLDTPTPKPACRFQDALREVSLQDVRVQGPMTDRIWKNNCPARVVSDKEHPAHGRSDQKEAENYIPAQDKLFGCNGYQQKLWDYTDPARSNEDERRVNAVLKTGPIPSERRLSRPPWHHHNAYIGTRPLARESLETRSAPRAQIPGEWSAINERSSNDGSDGQFLKDAGLQVNSLHSVTSAAVRSQVIPSSSAESSHTSFSSGTHWSKANVKTNVQPHEGTENDKPRDENVIHPSSSSDAFHIELHDLRKSLADIVAENTRLKKGLSMFKARADHSRTPTLELQQAFEPQEPELKAATSHNNLTPLELPQPSITSYDDDTAVESAPLRTDIQAPRSIPTAYAAQHNRNALVQPVTEFLPIELSSDVNVEERKLVAEEELQSSGELTPLESSVVEDVAAILATTSLRKDSTLHRLSRLVRMTKLELERSEQEGSRQDSAFQTDIIAQDWCIDWVLGRDSHCDAESQIASDAGVQESKRRRSSSYEEKSDKDDTKRLCIAMNCDDVDPVEATVADKHNTLFQNDAWFGRAFKASRQRTGLLENSDIFDYGGDQSFSTVDAEEVLRSLDPTSSIEGYPKLSETLDGCVSAYPCLSRKVRHDSSQEVDSIKPLFSISSYSELQPTVSETDRKQEEIQRGYAEDLSRVGMPRTTENDAEAKALEEELMAGDEEMSVSGNSEEEVMEVDIASPESRSTVDIELPDSLDDPLEGAQ